MQAALTYLQYFSIDSIEVKKFKLEAEPGLNGAYSELAGLPHTNSSPVEIPKYFIQAFNALKPIAQALESCIACLSSLTRLS